MLFFNWIGLVRESGSDPSKAVSILKDYYNNRILKYGLKRKLAGSSFLLNAKDILNDKNTDILYIYQYLLLAARRDYSFYKLYGERGLPLSYYPDIDRSLISHNPLLKIQNDTLYFKYEEL